MTQLDARRPALVITKDGGDLPVHMAIHLALCDRRGAHVTGQLGAFSSDARAKQACQESADEMASADGRTRAPLEWDESFEARQHSATYTIMLVGLDEPV